MDSSNIILVVVFVVVWLLLVRFVLPRFGVPT